MRSLAWHSVARTEARSVEHDNKALLAEHFGVVTLLFDEGVGLLLDQERLVFDWISCSQKLGASTQIVGPMGSLSLRVVGVKLLLFEVPPGAEADRKYDKKSAYKQNPYVESDVTYLSQVPGCSGDGRELLEPSSARCRQCL